ncbi:MAG: LysR family transcriptional regulator substrate-binding protein [Deltaproteobacteria bacterium]|nr:LysR family transcriptional regulator substrate-binding protein [Deltaproteobacteria bacterium]
MNLNRIRLFSIVASYSSVTKASQVLHVSQSSLSHQLSLLQKDYGVTLYKTTGHGIELTAEGRQFLAGIEPLLEGLERFEREFRRRSGGEELESLSIAGTYGLSASLLPSLAADFQKTHSHVQISLRTGNQSAIEQFVLEGKVEIAVITSPRTRSAALATEPYREEPFAAFVPIHHPLARKRTVTVSELLREPLVLRGSPTPENTIERMLREMEKGYRPKVAAFYDSADAVKVAVRKNTGVGLLYKDTIMHEARKREFKILKIEDLKLSLNTFIMYHKDRPLSAKAKLFLDFVRRRKHTHR